jgi:hypothetical protein
MLTTAAQKHGVQPQSLLAMVQDPANFQKLPQSEQQAFMNSMQQHIPQMNPMHGLNEMMNGIPGLGQWDMWKNMHPGGKLMALAGLLTAGGGMMGGSPGMAGAGGLAMLAPFLFHHFMNGGGGGAPEGGAEAPPAAPGAQPGAWAAGGGPAPQFPQPTGF